MESFSSYLTWIRAGSLTRQQAGPVPFLRRQQGESHRDTPPGTHPGLAPPWPDLLDNAAFQLSNLPDPISSAISEIILPFSYFRANRNTSLPAMIKCECSDLRRGRRTGQSQAKSWSLHTLLSSPFPSPRILSYFRILFEMSFSCTLCSSCKYSGTHCRKGMRVFPLYTVTHGHDNSNGSRLLSTHVSCAGLTLDISHLVYSSLQLREGFTNILNIKDERTKALRD